LEGRFNVILKISELTAKRMLFLVLLATLIFVTSHMLQPMKVRAMGMVELRSLHDPSVQPEGKFQQLNGCNNNSTCATQLESFPFVLPFP
jgi:hypothetical protein